MKTKQFSYLAEYNAFGIRDEEVKDPFLLGLSKDCYERLEVPEPNDSAPVIAFLCGREKGHYTIDYAYAYALRYAHIRLLDYEHCVDQLAGCHGLVLPGGAFASKKEYYAPEVDRKTLEEPGIRSQAYVDSFHTALFMGIPILGICAGAQVIAGECGGLLYPDRSYQPHTLEHKTKNLYAHDVIIKRGSFFHKIVGCTTLLTNSRHKERLKDLPYFTGFEIYARTPDGVPEAWGSKRDNILCVQWHPEDYVVKGDLYHKKIYSWLLNEATLFQFG